MGALTVVLAMGFCSMAEANFELESSRGREIFVVVELFQFGIEVVLFFGEGKEGLEISVENIVLNGSWERRENSSGSDGNGLFHRRGCLERDRGFFED